MIGVVDFGGSPLFVLPTPGEDKYTTPISDRALVDIDVAGSSDPFLWKNSSVRIFPGFYETYLSATHWMEDIIDRDSCDVDYYERNGEEIPDYYIKSWEDFEKKYEDPHPMFYRAWEDIVCRAYTAVLWEYIQRGNEDNILTSMQFDHLWSPAYYNFETDKLVLRLTCNFDLLEGWIQEHLDLFEKYLNRAWSSYDGFVSFVPNNYKELVDSHWYRTICLEYYIRTQVTGEPDVDAPRDTSDDTFYDSIEYTMYEWLMELFPEEVAARAEEMEKLSGEEK